MKTFVNIIRAFAAAAVLSLCMVSCNDGPFTPEDPVTTFQANHTYGYYFGQDLSNKTDHFVVQMIKGALDNEGNLASSGIVVSLDLNTVPGDGKGLPVAKYDCADVGDYTHPYTINPGYIKMGDQGYEIVGSYVGIKNTSSSSLVCYPIVDGYLQPSTSSASSYTFYCYVSINGEDFEASYSGDFQIFDQTVSDNSFNIAFADYLGDYYENGTNNYDFNLIKGDFDKDGNPVSDYTWLELDWNTELNVVKWDFFPFGTYNWIAYNDDQKFPAYTFIEGDYDKDEGYFASYIEFYNISKKESECHIVTGGKIDVQKDGNNYNMNIHVVCDNKQSYDFTYSGGIEFNDGRGSDAEPQSVKLQTYRKVRGHAKLEHKRPRLVLAQ